MEFFHPSRAAVIARSGGCAKTRVMWGDIVDLRDFYGSPLGQVILAILLSAYVATLLMMRRMAIAKPLPRFLDLQARNAQRQNEGAAA